MSLKGFHIVFISVSVLLAFGFGVYCLATPPVASHAWQAMGIVSLLGGCGLVAYEVSFLKKMRRLG